MRCLTRRTTTLLAAGLLTSLMATSAMAADVTQSVAGGTLSASSTVSTPLSAVTYSHTSQISAGELTLNVDDSRGTGEGWNVTVQSSAFAYTDGSGTPDTAHDIPASNFELTSAAAPAQVAGQAVDGTNGPKIVTGTGTLNTALTVVDANVDHGQGEYNQALEVQLTVPGQARAGTYTGTVTTTATSGPTA